MDAESSVSFQLWQAPLAGANVVKEGKKEKEGKEEMAKTSVKLATEMKEVKEVKREQLAVKVV